MKTEQPILITSITAAEDLSASKNLFIGFDGNLCAASAKALGVLNANTDLAEQAPVTVVGIALVLSGAAITAGAGVEANANSKAITVVSGELNGYALDDASEADEIIRVLLK